MWRKIDKDSVEYFRDSSVKLLKDYKAKVISELKKQMPANDPQLAALESHITLEVDRKIENIKRANQTSIVEQLKEMDNYIKKEKNDLEKKYGDIQIEATERFDIGLNTHVPDQPASTRPRVTLPLEELQKPFVEHAFKLTCLLTPEVKIKFDTIRLLRQYIDETEKPGLFDKIWNKTRNTTLLEKRVKIAKACKAELEKPNANVREIINRYNEHDDVTKGLGTYQTFVTRDGGSDRELVTLRKEKTDRLAKLLKSQVEALNKIKIPEQPVEREVKPSHRLSRSGSGSKQ